MNFASAQDTISLTAYRTNKSAVKAALGASSVDLTVSRSSMQEKKPGSLLLCCVTAKKV